MDSNELSKLKVNNTMCAPVQAPDNVQDHHTCFTRNELLSIINAFNNYIINNKLCSDKLVDDSDKDIVCVENQELITITSQDSIEKLWYKIYKKLSPICKYESCWVSLDFINRIKDKKLIKKLRYFTFKPKFYNNREKWLNTLDIDYVMQQYARLHKDFLYIGTEPCDFYKFKKLNYNRICNSKTVGLVFNLDKSDKPGSHWTSLFIDNTERNIYYFDSTGQNPNKYIRHFIKNYPVEYSKNYPVEYGKNSNNQYIHSDKVFTVYINKKVHQKGNSECGVYSIYFLIKKIKTKDPINNKRITDKNMNDFRKYIFNYN